MIAVPLGVLKENNIKFTPSLSSAKKASIQRLGFGVINKVALNFSAPFWPRTDFTWYVPAIDGYYPAAINWNVYAPNRYWSPPTIVCSRFSVIHTQYRAVLIFMTIGEFALAMEKKTDEEIISEVMSVLKTIYPGATAPLSHLITRWHSDKHARGTFRREAT